MPVINDQWETDEDSLRGRGDVSYYIIMANRLTESGNAPYAGVLYDWPVQMGRKINFDYNQFVEAYRAALLYFQGMYDPPVDPDTLEASIQKGFELNREIHK